MGVSGCGKTTIAKLLSKKMDIPYFDADDFHPQQNIKKMIKGIGLDDHDRKPWLKSLNGRLKEWQKNKGAIVACSALKEKYRKTLTSGLDIQWIFLEGSIQLIKNRLDHRKGHFMNAGLLQSQFDCLEVPNYGTKICIDNSPENIVNELLTHVKNE